MRDNNWKYIKDNSALISNAYTNRWGESYLSYWKFGLGISHDKSIIEEWYSQRELVPIKPQITVTELGVYYMYCPDFDQ